MKTQKQAYYEAQKKIGEANELFIELVKDGLTRNELEINIERRPELWARFSGFLETLPRIKS